MIVNVEINNVPRDHERYIVARLNEGELWYWGSWEEEELADIAAEEVDGIVVEVHDDKF